MTDIYIWCGIMALVFALASFFIRKEDAHVPLLTAIVFAILACAAKP